MATGEVYRIITAEGHEHDWHGGVARLKEAHPGAVITGRRVVNAVGEGTYEPYSLVQAAAAERKAESPAKATPKPAPKPARDKPTPDEAPAKP